MQKKLVAILTLVLIPGLAFPALVFAVGSAGFENASYSARTLAQGNAVVARPQDPSTVLFNPAGLIELPGVQTSLGLQWLDWRIFHHNRVTADQNQNEMKLLLLPSAYLTAHPGKLLGDRVAVGVGVNSPFGLASTFPSIGVGRYTGYKNSLRTLATTMAGAVKITDWFSVGAGAINYWIYDYGQTFNYPNAFITGTAGAADGRALTETDGYGWGWNLGALLKPLPKHKIGVSYRGKADVQVHGRVLIDDLVAGGTPGQGYDTFPHFQSGAHSDVPLPANLTLAYAYEPSEKWAAEFDFGPTFWGVFKDQDFAFDRPNATLRALGRIPRDYRTTWSFNWGGHYRIRKNIDLLGGFFFYTAASPKIHVDNFLPDANRYGWTFGTSYKIGDRTTIDFAYLFVLFGSRNISNPIVFAKTGESIDGRYTSILHGAFATFRYQFDFPFGKRARVQDTLPKVGVAEGTLVK